jgi:two-component system, chemotaxis family, chemotaxis protein CheY
MVALDNFRNMPILVVDDYRSIQRLIRTLLMQIGFNAIDFADSGAAALSKLRDRHYALVVSDMNMVPMSGLDLLREVRRDEHLKDIPFIMVTGAVDLDKVVAAKEAGVTDYIVKPFATEVLQRKLASVLARAHPDE